MKKIKFYVCRECGNVITANANAEISCCGKKLSPLDAVKEEEQHKLDVEVVDEEYSVSRKSHPMEKEHYLSFIAYVTSDKLNVCRLYPEQGNEVRFRRSGHGMLYAYCSLEGLFVQRI